MIGILAFALWQAQIPANYYSGTDNLSGAALKTRLHQIIKAGHQTKSYDELYTGYRTTDTDTFYEDDNSVLDIYSENPTGRDPYNYTHGQRKCGSYNSEGDCYNREHIIPQSLFGSNSPMVSDIHFVRPSDGKVNGQRGNLPFGMVRNANYTSQNGSKRGANGHSGYNGTVFEPIDEFKGDVARMIFYFVTRYEDRMRNFSEGNMLAKNTFPSLQAWQLQVLWDWHHQDPVSNAEIIRNNASYTYQGNRNPFIDNPHWVASIWGALVVQDTIPPSAPMALVATNPTANTIVLSWGASTDNLAVSSYEIFANGVLVSTVSGTLTSHTVTGLTPNTTYTFYIRAKDAAGNVSANSNSVSETTLNGATPATHCGTEDFENIPANNGNYTMRTWTNNGITWTATDARTDETIQNRAIVIRNGSLSSSTINGGIRALSFKTQVKYSGTHGSLLVKINGIPVQTINYNAVVGAHPVETWVVDNINIAGDITISLENTTRGNRIAIDDMSWSCYTLSTDEVSTHGGFSLYPNPITDGILRISGKNVSSIQKLQIFSADGRLIREFSQPFKERNELNIQFLPAGVYTVVSEKFSQKIIIQ